MLATTELPLSLGEFSRMWWKRHAMDASKPADAKHTICSSEHAAPSSAGWQVMVHVSRWNVRRVATCMRNLASFLPVCVLLHLRKQTVEKGTSQREGGMEVSTFSRADRMG